MPVTRATMCSRPIWSRSNPIQRIIECSLGRRWPHGYMPPPSCGRSCRRRGSPRRASATTWSAPVSICRRAGHDRVVEAARLAAGVAGADHVTRGVRVLVDERAERVADLVQRDQRALRRAARRGRLAAADAAVGERVEDRQRLQVLRRARDAEDRGDVGVDDPVVRLVAGLARVGGARRVVLRERGRVAADRRGCRRPCRARAGRCSRSGRSSAARCSWSSIGPSRTPVSRIVPSALRTRPSGSQRTP